MGGYPVCVSYASAELVCNGRFLVARTQGGKCDGPWAPTDGIEAEEIVFGLVAGAAKFGAVRIWTTGNANAGLELQCEVTAPFGTTGPATLIGNGAFEFPLVGMESSETGILQGSLTIRARNWVGGGASFQQPLQVVKVMPFTCYVTLGLPTTPWKSAWQGQEPPGQPFFSPYAEFLDVACTAGAGCSEKSALLLAIHGALTARLAKGYLGKVAVYGAWLVLDLSGFEPSGTSGAGGSLSTIGPLKQFDGGGFGSALVEVEYHSYFDSAKAALIWKANAKSYQLITAADATAILFGLAGAHGVSLKPAILSGSKPFLLDPDKVLNPTNAADPLPHIALNPVKLTITGRWWFGSDKGWGGPNSNIFGAAFCPKPSTAPPLLLASCHVFAIDEDGGCWDAFFQFANATYIAGECPDSVFVEKATGLAEPEYLNLIVAPNQGSIAVKPVVHVKNLAVMVPFDGKQVKAGG